MEKILSIIIPVYNTSKYIEKCLNSILNQSMNNLEIIIVNDGSTDNSEEIIKIKNLNKQELQTEIINEVRKKNENAKTFAEQGYNIYVRDIRSDEYLIENISNYFLGENGYLYVVFAYGNKNYIDTIDVILF